MSDQDDLLSRKVAADLYDPFLQLPVDFMKAFPPAIVAECVEPLVSCAPQPPPVSNPGAGIMVQTVDQDHRPSAGSDAWGRTPEVPHQDERVTADGSDIA